jgi:phospholipase C
MNRTSADAAREDRRGSCGFRSGATVLDTLGIGKKERGQIPIDHVIILIQENRAFDHYFGRMPQYGQIEVDGIPEDYVNRDGSGGFVSPGQAPTTCISPDTPHSWNASHRAWNDGEMDGFFIEASSGGNDGGRAISWYDETQLPFYYWLYSNYSMADRWFAPVLGPTWPNRDFIYAATSDGRMDNSVAITVPTLFDALTDAGVGWGIYVDGAPRQRCIGYTRGTPGVFSTHAFFSALADGSLPSVSFIDGTGRYDEHPPNDIQVAEDWVRSVYLAVTSSPLWPSTAFIFTYDEGGGFFDHVPPPEACPPTPELALDFSQLGVRLPAVVISPYSKPGYVSHEVHHSTSITRFVEMLFDLPALTGRDANADALLDMFDFSSPQLLDPPEDPPAAGTGGCPG